MAVPWRRARSTSRLTLDESEIGTVSVVGGFIVQVADETAVVAAWRRHKAAVGLRHSEELKFNMSRSTVSQRLDKADFPQRTRVPMALQAIVSMPVRLIAAVHVVEQNRPARDAYLDGFDWCLARYRDFVSSRPRASGHQVLVDQPSGLRKGELCSTLMCSPQESPFALYERRWSMGSLHPQDNDSGPSLEHLGFVPELAVSCSSYSDMLQIADHIAGCTAQFVARYLDGANDSAWRDENFCIIASKYWRGNDNNLAVVVRPADTPGRVGIERALDRCAGLKAAGPRDTTSNACCGQHALRGPAQPRTSPRQRC